MDASALAGVAGMLPDGEEPAQGEAALSPGGTIPVAAWARDEEALSAQLGNPRGQADATGDADEGQGEAQEPQASDGQNAQADGARGAEGARDADGQHGQQAGSGEALASLVASAQARTAAETAGAPAPGPSNEEGDDADEPVPGEDGAEAGDEAAEVEFDPNSAALAEVRAIPAAGGDFDAADLAGEVDGSVFLGWSTSQDADEGGVSIPAGAQVRGWRFSTVGDDGRERTCDLSGLVDRGAGGPRLRLYAQWRSAGVLDAVRDSFDERLASMGGEIDRLLDERDAQAEADRRADDPNYAEDQDALERVGSFATGRSFTNGRIIVGLEDGASLAERDSDKVASSREGVYLLQYPTQDEAEAAYARYTGYSGVEFVDTDQVLRVTDDEAGPSTGDAAETEPGIVSRVGGAVEQQGIDNKVLLEGSPVADLWSIGSGEDAGRVAGEQGSAPGEHLVALVDTGAPEGGGVVYRSTTIESADAAGLDDDNGHGTAMRDAMLAENGAAKIASIKALDAGGVGTAATVYAAIEQAVGYGADVINLSFCAYVLEENAAIGEAVRDAVDAGCVVVAAAGNESSNASYYTPACIEQAFTVASVDGEGNLAGNSNFGSLVDAYVVARSTSFAAARTSGWLSANYGEGWEDALAASDLTVDAGRVREADAFVARDAADEADGLVRAAGTYNTYNSNPLGRSYSKATRNIGADGTLTLTRETTTGSAVMTGTQYEVKLTPGKYKLEVWGSKSYAAASGSRAAQTVAGGYSVGLYEVKATTSVYVVCGGTIPTSGSGTQYQRALTWNGGGVADDYYEGGGGATHIALADRGELANFVNNKNEVLIVAGGAGASTPGWSGATGGVGGGATGGTGTGGTKSSGWDYGTGGSQTAGGVCQTSSYCAYSGGFGYGSNGWNGYANRSNDIRPGGGGGYYGGGPGWGMSAGGGSGYVNTSSERLTAGTVAAGGTTVTTATYQQAGTVATGATSAGNKYLGEGKAVITRLTGGENDAVSWGSSDSASKVSYTAASGKVGSQTTVGFTGSAQPLTLPAGKYRFEVWGGTGGGNGTSAAPAGYQDGGSNTQSAFKIADGGYTYGEVTLASETTVYVYVGQMGAYSASSGGAYGGGGAHKWSSDGVVRGGGGMSHVSLTRYNDAYAGGSWSQYGAIVVAGGGGSHDNGDGTVGGAGGGFNSLLPRGGATAASQTAGYARGVGVLDPGGSDSSGGAGGWWGSYGGGDSGGGGGGTGHLGDQDYLYNASGAQVSGTAMNSLADGTVVRGRTLGAANGTAYDLDVWGTTAKRGNTGFVECPAAAGRTQTYRHDGFCRITRYEVDYHQSDSAAAVATREYASLSSVAIGSTAVTQLGGWAFQGWVKESTTSTAATHTAAGTAVFPADTYSTATASATFVYHMYPVFQRKYTYGMKTKATATQLYNPCTANGTYTTADSAISSAAEATGYDDSAGWSIAGWRADGTAGAATWTASGAFSRTSSPEVYAVYSRTVTLSYDANGGEGSVAAYASAQYFNAGGTGGASPASYSIQLPAGTGFTRADHHFLESDGLDCWKVDGADYREYSAGRSDAYQWAPAVTDEPSKTAYIQWEEERIRVTYHTAQSAPAVIEALGQSALHSDVSLTAREPESSAQLGIDGDLAIGSDYTFAGWASGAASAAVFKAAGAPITADDMTDKSDATRTLWTLDLYPVFSRTMRSGYSPSSAEASRYSATFGQLYNLSSEGGAYSNEAAPSTDGLSGSGTGDDRIAYDWAATSVARSRDAEQGFHR